MAAFNKFDQFIEDLHKGVHNFTSDATCTVTVALTTVAPIAGNSILGDLTQVSYTNFSSRVVTGITAEQVAGILHLTATDLVLTAAGTTAAFRYIVLYNDDAVNDPLIGWYDYGVGGVPAMATGDTFTIDFATDILTAQ